MESQLTETQQATAKGGRGASAGSGLPPAALKAVSEYEQRMRFVMNRLEEAEQMKAVGDWAHTFDALSSAHRELALCMVDAAFLR